MLWGPLFLSREGEELGLRACYQDWGIQSAARRYFTAHGPRGHENHAVMAMIARSFIDQDPFVVWRNGQQVRNWTYVSDIVDGTILAAERIEDGTAVNLGTMERTRVIDAVEEALRYTHKEHLRLELHPEMPTSPMNRVADSSLAKKLLGWEPKVKFVDGLHETLDWYYRTREKDKARVILENRLTERQQSGWDENTAGRLPLWLGVL
jgi:nucleoside-diphosphate-sugar epimerase